MVASGGNSVGRLSHHPDDGLVRQQQQQVRKRGLIGANQRRITCLSLFWHFLDLVWIGVFTFVYLLGVLR